MSQAQKHLQKVINDYKNSPELKCNHCGTIFKGSHECDHEKLKDINKELKSLLVWSIKKLPELHKSLACNEYSRITGEKIETL